MLMFVIPILLMSSAVNSLDSWPQKRSVASESQIRFAVENKYDQTGPGAKGREYAYNTYNNLEEALVGYLDDPDTKLPEQERAKAVQKLQESRKPWYQSELERPSYVNPFSDKNALYQNSNVDVNVVHTKGYLGNYEHLKPVVHPYGPPKIQAIKQSPLNLAHFSRFPQEASLGFNPFSYGVHDKLTAGLQSTQDPGVRTGSYTFLDANGLQRTVQYVANDAQGFRTIVSRSASNSQ